MTVTDTSVATLPFVYAAECVAKGKRLSWTHHVRDVAQFAIPTIGKDSAPDAFEVVRNDDFAQYVADAKAGGLEDRRDAMAKLRGEAPRPKRRRLGADVLTLRTFEGRLYRPIGPEGGPPLDAVGFVEQAGLPASHFNAIHGPDGGLRASDLPVLPILKDAGYDRDMTVRVPELPHVLSRVASDAGKPYAYPSRFAGADPSAPARVKSDDREARRREAAACYATTLAFVDGEAWGTNGASEPYYAVDVDAKKGIVALRVTTGDYRSSEQSPFRADRREEAEAFAALTAERNGYALKLTSDEIRIKDRGSVLRDDAAMLAECLLRGVDKWRARERDEWPEALNEAASDLVRLGKDADQFGLNPQSRNPAWRNAVFAAAEKAVGAAATMEDEEASEFVRAIAFATERWTETERRRFPDVPDPEAEAESLSPSF